MEQTAPLGIETSPRRQNNARVERAVDQPAPGIGWVFFMPLTMAALIGLNAWMALTMGH